MPGEVNGTRKTRSRLEDVAAAAGVGIATVDRVLNDRGGVSPETAHRVLRAARDLGLRRALPVPHRKGIRIEVLLTRPDLPLIGRMSEAFANLAATLDHSIIVQRTVLASDRAARLAERLRASTADATIIFARDEPVIRDALAERSRAGAPVVTLISDLPATPRLAYAGTDHGAAGRTAGYYIGQMARKGSVLVLCNHHSYQAHLDRVAGFTEALARHGPGLAVADILQGADQPLLSQRLLEAAVRQHRDVVAIYNAGAAHEAVEQVLRQAGRPIVFIGHELTPHTRAMAQAGLMSLIIDQNPEHQARFAIDILRQHFGHELGSPLRNDPLGNTGFTLHGPYNLGDAR